MTTEAVSGLVAHLFRHQAGRLVAVLTRALGAGHLDLAEDVVQDALVSALRVWPIHGVPDNPPAWLLQVARRKAIDQLRRTRAWTDRIEPAFARHLDAAAASEAVALDDTLALMFMTCHPSLPESSRIALTLKIASGLDVHEIGRALLTDPRNVAQRIVRAKRLLRESACEIALPSDAELQARLGVVLEVLALLFTTGYGARDGDVLVREDLCAEAVRLARLLTQHPRTATPESHALVALLLLQSARLPARLTEAGELALLAEQDRRRWLDPLIAAGLRHLDLASTGDRVSVWHLQAGIAAAHTCAPSTADTPWPHVVTMYDDLVRLRPTPVVRLNRAIAIGMRDGPRAGLDALADVDEDHRLQDYHLLHATRGHFLAATGDHAAARLAFTRALDCPLSVPERRFLVARRDSDIMG
ncbi:MAG: RNA polymerase sigma24 factor [Acidimicrobiia bacterium]